MGAFKNAKEMQASRKSPIHLPLREKANRSSIIFMTICTKDREPCLLTVEREKVICDAWNQANHYLVGKYLLMPDHIHFFCSPATFPAEEIGSWVKYFKSLCSRNWPTNLPSSLWQRGYWDKQIFTRDSYINKWAYIRDNPVRAGLVSRAKDWPFSGEQNVLEWHD